MLSFKWLRVMCLLALFQSVPICQVQGFLAIIAYAMNLVGFGGNSIAYQRSF